MMPTHQPRRRGVSLTEILIAASITGFVLNTAITTLHRVMRQQQIQRSAIDCQMSVSRLAIIFRQDVHRSHTCQLEPAGETHPKLVLDGPNGTHIEYTVNGPGVDRLVRCSATVVHRDRFPLGRDCQARWDMKPLPDRATLIVSHQHMTGPPGDASGSTPIDTRQLHTVRVEAVIGRDHRFPPPREPPRKRGDSPFSGKDRGTGKDGPGNGVPVRWPSEAVGSSPSVSEARQRLTR